MSKLITNPRTIRAKQRRMQADIDALEHTAMKGFSGCNTRKVCNLKQHGSHHNKVMFVLPSKTFKRWGNE